jgi:hypothetical protein
MSEEKDRSEVIATWHDLQEAIGDFERGRVDMSVVHAAYTDYRLACWNAGEGYYSLSNILHEDMPDIDFSYPNEKPDFEVDKRGKYVTPQEVSDRGD